MDHKSSTSSTSYKFERKWSLVNALAKELADIGDEINERYVLDSLSHSEEITLIQTLSKSKPSRAYQHSHYVGSTSKSEAIRLFYYATPVLVVAYLFYRRKS
ncbi:hypothetical protein KSF78_0006301 [Schistosoma japonicum]|nr:hypothetical protein KSF78_0006301 [Schistosoma japonicum]KAH8871644.1 hypothetical protein KSF78_0006301 [Schistosoma japonicum]